MNKSEPNFMIEQELAICQEYLEGLSTLKLAKKWGCRWDATINRILKKHKIVKRDRSHQRRVYSIDENFFNAIDTPEKAYFLGFLYADGGFVRDTVYLSVKRSDCHILGVFQNWLSTDKPIKHYTNNKGCEYSRLDISNKQLVLNLCKFGVVARKTHKITFPKWLADHLVHHFIRGYFDGDGGLTIQHKRNKAVMTFTSNQIFCTELKDILSNTLATGGTVYEVKNKKIHRLAIGGNVQILRVLTWMYTDSTAHLGRKFNIYQKLITNPISKT